MDKTREELYKEIEISEKERKISDDKSDIAKGALKVVGSTAVTCGGLIALRFLVPEIFNGYTSDEAITFAAVTLLRLKEAGATVSLVGSLAGLYGTYRFGSQINDDVKRLKKHQKELVNLKR